MIGMNQRARAVGAGADADEIVQHEDDFVGGQFHLEVSGRGAVKEILPGEIGLAFRAIDIDVFEIAVVIFFDIDGDASETADELFFGNHRAGEAGDQLRLEFDKVGAGLRADLQIEPCAYAAAEQA